MRYRSVVICKDGRRPSRLDSAKQATINRFRWLDQIHCKSDHAKTPNTPHLFFHDHWITPISVCGWSMIKNKAVVDIRFMLPTIESVRVYGAMPYMHCHLASRFEYTTFWRSLFMAIRLICKYANMMSSTKPLQQTTWALCQHRWGRNFATYEARAEREARDTRLRMSSGGAASSYNRRSSCWLDARHGQFTLPQNCRVSSHRGWCEWSRRSSAVKAANSRIAACCIILHACDCISTAGNVPWHLDRFSRLRRSHMHGRGQ